MPYNRADPAGFRSGGAVFFTGLQRHEPVGHSLSSPVGLYTFVELITFQEYVAVREAGLGRCYAAPLLCETDEGLRAFIDAQNSSFMVFLQQLLTARRITDSRLVREAEALVADK